jgi:mono/diheme cytochrome c family protein
MSYLVACVAGVGFFVMSVALLGEWPRRVLTEQTLAMAPAHALGLTETEERGRAIYAREGCGYCHTQQIRYLDTDIARFGSPTLAWETRFDFPHLWGTRRIGPDLARAGATRPEDWQFAHLFAPRSVVPLSIMPAYRSFFDGAPDRPRQSARDLVAYLETLGRARELAWPEGDEAARAAAPDDPWAAMALDAPLLNAHPARTRPRGGAPSLDDVEPSTRGPQLWTDYCAACHGDSGESDGPGAPWLRPRPNDLTEHEYTRRRVADVLWNGVLGTAMPAWRDHPPADLAALVAVVRGFSSADQTPDPTAEVVTLGAGVYAANCAQCHGDEGRGDGFAVNELDVAPTDFSGQRPSVAAALRALRTGVDGTPMAPWTDRLDEDELLAVAHFVRVFFEADGATAGGSR